jgi:hypothetical protein
MKDYSLEFIASMNLLRNGVKGKTRAYQIASGRYNTKFKPWKIKAINYTILLTLALSFGALIYWIWQ